MNPPRAAAAVEDLAGSCGETAPGGGHRARPRALTLTHAVPVLRSPTGGWPLQNPIRGRSFPAQVCKLVPAWLGNDAII